MDDPNNFGPILLVEDNPGDVRLTKEMLKESELEPSIHVVSDGSEAVDFLRRRGEYRDAPRPDAILLDLHLPRMDGEEVVSEMGEAISDIPVIVLSGSQQGADLKLADIEDRVDACMEKPLDPDAFEEFVRSSRE